MNHGSNVRSPSLIGDTDYVMKTWGKEHTYQPVRFLHFATAQGNYKSPNKQLKDMLATDLYCFKGAEGKFNGKMLDNCLVHETTEARITFFTVDGTVAPTKVVVKKRASKVAPVAETPAVTEPVVEAPVAATESALDRKRRVDRERKAAKRAAAKAVLATPEASTESNEPEVATTEVEVIDVEASETETDTVSDVVASEAIATDSTSSGASA